MSAKMTLKCPSCGQKFKLEISEKPRFCPLCDYDTQSVDSADAERLSRMLAAQQPPAYRGQIQKTVDNLYSGMERASTARAEAAAEMAGVDVSEMSALKITNMQDQLRAGDTAHVPVVNDVTRAMAAAGGITGFNRNPEINNFRRGVSSGPYPQTGVNVMSEMQRISSGRTPQHIT
jgi:uncharacterized Zn finger protein (UPF0148 family)